MTRPSRSAIEWLALAAALALLGAALAGGEYLARGDIERRERERLAAYAEIAEKNLAAQLVAIDRALERIIADLQPGAANGSSWQRANVHLGLLSDTVVGLDALTVAGADGQVLAASDAVAVGGSVAGEAYFQQARQARNPRVLQITPPFRPQPATHSLRLVRSIAGAGGEFGGVVVAEIAADYMRTLLESLRYAPDAWAGIVHGDGVLFMIAADRADLAGADLGAPGSEFSEHVASGRQDSVVAGLSPLGGTPRLSALRTLRAGELAMDKALVTYVSRDTAQVFAAWRRESQILAIVWGLLALVAGGALYAYQRSRRAQAMLAQAAAEERWQVEQELIAGKAKLEAALSSMSDMVFIADTDGRLVHINDAFAAYHKFPSTADCFPSARDYAAVIEVFSTRGEPVAFTEWPVWRALRGEAVSGEELVIRRRDTDETWVGSYNYSPIRNKAGEIVGAVVAARDITERKKADDALQVSRMQLRALTARLVDVREEERTRLARELHDELGQLLTGLALNQAWLKRALTAVGDPQVRQMIDAKFHDIDELTESMIRKVREISSSLRPSVLDNLGLVAAIEFEARRFQQRSEIDCTVHALEPIPPLEAAQSTVLFRILQEILTNIARHAQATQVHISLLASDGELVLEVHDNGRGITPEQINSAAALGLLGMRERAAQCGGQVDIVGEDGQGTIVTVRLPLDPVG